MKLSRRLLHDYLHSTPIHGRFIASSAVAGIRLPGSFLFIVGQRSLLSRFGLRSTG